MEASELWDTHARFIRGIAEYFHWKFPKVLELDEKVSIAYIYAEKARKTFDSSKGTFKSYGGRAIARGVLKEINREIESRFKKDSRTHQILFPIFTTANFEGADLDKKNCNYTRENIQNGILQYVPEADYFLDDRIGAYRDILASPGGRYAWLHKVYGLSLTEIGQRIGKSAGEVSKDIGKFRRIRKS